MLMKKNLLNLSEFDRPINNCIKSVNYSSVFDSPMASFIMKFLSAHKAFRTFP